LVNIFLQEYLKQNNWEEKSSDTSLAEELKTYMNANPPSLKEYYLVFGTDL